MSSKKAINIIILDASQLYCNALADVLRNQFNASVSSASDEEELNTLLENTSPDIIVYDLFSTYKNFGLSVQAIHKATPSSKVIVLSFDSNEELVEMCITNGASGFFNKKITDSDLITECIGKVIRGEISILATQAA